MKLKYLGVVFMAIFININAEEQNSWSYWNGAHDSVSSETKVQQTVANVTTADAEVDEIIETILASGRQGRNLDGFDDVYSDETIKDALNSGDDTQARNLIREKLCSLGLMQCDTIVGKRPYFSPDELIYAQPVAIRPVGRPIASVPIRQQQLPPPSSHRGPYGPPKPMPSPHLNTNNNNNNHGGNLNVPPRKVGYAPSKQFYNGPPSSKPFLSNGPPGSFPSGPPFEQQGPIYFSKPPGPIYEGPDSPYEFEHPGKITLDHSQSSLSSSYAQHSEHHGHNHHLHHNPEKPTIVVNAQGGAATNDQASGSALLQQHVHHHYHHLEGESKQPNTVVVNNPVPVPVSHGNGINEFSSINGFSPMNSAYDYSGKYSAGSSGVNSGLGSVNGISGSGVYGSSNLNSYQTAQSSILSSGIKPVFEGLSSQLSNQGPPTFNGGLNTNVNSYGQQTTGFSSSGGGGSFGGLNTNAGQSVSGVFNGNTNSFHSTNPDYFKKELNVNGGLKANGLSQYSQNQYLSSQEKYQGFESSRQENFDCVCVSYEQCPANDVIGRKDDLILPLDPRHLDKDIEALSDDAVIATGNDTIPVVRVTKETEKNATVTADDEKTEVKKISKREAPQAKATDKQSSDEIEAVDGEGRLLGLGGIHGGQGGKRVVPTFGVSFGLPYPSGGYPLNPYGSYPAQNPYFGAISPNGLNLGLLNVNPLVSFQVSKNEYGEKLLKPLVNLHVTPNEHLIHKVGNLFHAKKEGFHHHGGIGGGGGINQHYHHHTHIAEPPAIYHPHHHHESPHYPSHHYPTGPTGGYGFSPASSYPSGPGYGFPSGNGYYRDGSSSPNIPSELDYNPNAYYSRSANLTNSEQFQNYNYQSIYPQNSDKLLNTAAAVNQNSNNNYANDYSQYSNSNQTPNQGTGRTNVAFPTSRKRRDVSEIEDKKIDLNAEERSVNPEKRQAFYQQQQQRPSFSTFQNPNNFQNFNNQPNQQPNQQNSFLNQNSFQNNQIQQCGPRQVCCRRPFRPPQSQNLGQCGTRNAQGITGRIKNPVYVDGDSEFGEYPWQVAILKKDPKESVYVCGGSLIDNLHVVTAAHCIKTYTQFDLRVRLGEWDVNHDVEFYPYVERDVSALRVHPEYYAGTLDNDLAILRLDKPVDFTSTPHISPACLPDKFADFTGARCWTTGWGKDAFGDYGKYQNILKEVDVPIIGDSQCQQQLRNTRLGYNYKLNPGFICAGGEEGKDACKGDGGGPLVCERNGHWQLVGVVSWGIGCGQVNVPGVYVRVSHYLDWIQQITRGF